MGRKQHDISWANTEGHPFPHLLACSLRVGSGLDALCMLRPTAYLVMIVKYCNIP